MSIRQHQVCVGGEWQDLKPTYQFRWVPCLGESVRIYNQYLGGGTQMVTETTCVAEEHTPCTQRIQTHCISIGEEKASAAQSGADDGGVSWAS